MATAYFPWRVWRPPYVHGQVGDRHPVVVYRRTVPHRLSLRLLDFGRSDNRNKWWITIFLGSIIGATLANFIDGSILLLFFAIFSFFIAIHIFYTKSYSIKTYNFLKSIQQFISFLIGSFSSILGIGGGTLSVPLLISCGRSVKKAVGTSSGIGFLISIPATVVFLITGFDVANRPIYSLGYISLIPFILISIGTMISVPLSVNIMHNVNELIIKRFFCILLLISSLKMLNDLSF